MIYVGSKTRLWGELKSHVLEHIEDVAFYFEPFGGGMNTILKVPDVLPRIACDLDPFAIWFWQALQQGYEIPTLLCTRETYNDAREISDYVIQNDDTCGLTLQELFEVACWRFLGSFSGRPFDGWVGSSENVDFYSQRRTSVLTQIAECDNFQNVVFLDALDYRTSMGTVGEAFGGASGIVYCDPPYRNVRIKGRRSKLTSFDSNAFWGWAVQVRDVHYIYVSEYEAPNTFSCIWEKDVPVMLSTRNSNRESVPERLFV